MGALELAGEAVGATTLRVRPTPERRGPRLRRSHGPLDHKFNPIVPLPTTGVTPGDAEEKQR